MSSGQQVNFSILLGLGGQQRARVRGFQALRHQGASLFVLLGTRCETLRPFGAGVRDFSFFGTRAHEKAVPGSRVRDTYAGGQNLRVFTSKVQKWVRNGTGGHLGVRVKCKFSLRLLLFIVFFAMWLTRDPWEVGKGGGIINPPPAGSKDFDRRPRVDGFRDDLL